METNPLPLVSFLTTRPEASAPSAEATGALITTTWETSGRVFDFKTNE